MAARFDDVNADVKRRLEALGISQDEYVSVYLQSGMDIRYLEYEMQQRRAGAVGRVQRDYKAELAALNLSTAELKEYRALGLKDDEIIRQHKIQKNHQDSRAKVQSPSDKSRDGKHKAERTELKISAEQLAIYRQLGLSDEDIRVQAQFLQRTQQERKDKAEAVHKRAVTLNAGADGYSAKENTMKVNNLTIEQTYDNLEQMYGAQLDDPANKKRIHVRMTAFVKDYQRRNAANYFATHIGTNGANIPLEVEASAVHYCKSPEWERRLLRWWLASEDTNIKESSVADRQQSFVDALQDCWRGHNIQDEFNRDDGLPASHSCGIGYGEVFCGHFFGKHPANVFVAEPKYNNMAGDFALDVLTRLFFTLSQKEQVQVVEYCDKSGDVEAAVAKVAHNFYELAKATIVTDAKQHFGAKIFELVDFQKGLKIAIEGIEYLPLPEPGKEPEFVTEARDAVHELDTLIKRADELLAQASQTLTPFRQTRLNGVKEADEQINIARIQSLNVQHARHMMKEHEVRLEEGLKKGTFESLGLAQIATHNILSALPLGQQAFQRMNVALELVNSHVKQLDLQKKLQEVAAETRQAIADAVSLIEGIGAELKVAAEELRKPDALAKLEASKLCVANAEVLMKNFASAEALMKPHYDAAMRHAAELSTLSQLDCDFKNYCSVLPLIKQNVAAIKEITDEAGRLHVQARQLESGVVIDPTRIAQAQQQAAIALVNAGQQGQGGGLVFGGPGNPLPIQLPVLGIQVGQALPRIQNT